MLEVMHTHEPCSGVLPAAHTHARTGRHTRVRTQKPARTHAPKLIRSDEGPRLREDRTDHSGNGKRRPQHFQGWSRAIC